MKYRDVYGIAFATSATIFIVSLWLGSPIVLIPLVVSLSIIATRFIAGFGLLISYATFCMYSLKYLSPLFKRRRRESIIIRRTLDFLAIIIAAVIIINSIRNIVVTKMIGQSPTLLGVLLTLITVYLLPIWKEDKSFRFDESFAKKVRNLLNSLALRIKKGYYKYFTQDYLRAYSLDYLIYRCRLDSYRSRIAYYLFPLLLLSLVGFPATLPLVVMPLIRIYREKEIVWIDKLLLIISFAAIMSYVAYASMIIAIEIPTFIIEIPYILGVLVALIIYYLVIM